MMAYQTKTLSSGNELVQVYVDPDTGRPLLMPVTAIAAFAGDITQADILGNGLIEGGAEWVSGLTFDVSVIKFALDGLIYNTASETSVTLSAADPTNPRIDVIVANTDGTVSVVEGTPAVTPVKPEIDTSTQIEITFAIISAAATTPDGVLNTTIYDENSGSPTEWDATENTAGARITLNSTSDPYSGTTHIVATSMQAGDVLTFTDDAAFDVNNLDSVSFRIKPTAFWGRGRLTISAYNATTKVSDDIVLKHDDITLDTNTSAWIHIILSNGRFNFTSSTIDNIKFVRTGRPGDDISFQIDSVKYNTGTPIPDNPDTSTIKNNYIATTDPTVNDDSSEGYEVGSEWINLTGDSFWKLVDDTEGAAIWVDASVSDNMYTSDGTIADNPRTATINNDAELVFQRSAGVITSEMIRIADNASSQRTLVVQGSPNTTGIPVFQAENTSGIGYAARFNSLVAGNQVIQADGRSSSTSSADEVASFTMYQSTGPGVVGQGAYITLGARGGGSNTEDYLRLVTTLTDDTDAAEITDFSVRLMNAGSPGVEVFNVNGAGGGSMQLADGKFDFVGTYGTVSINEQSPFLGSSDALIYANISNNGATTDDVWGIQIANNFDAGGIYLSRGSNATEEALYVSNTGSGIAATISNSASGGTALSVLNLNTGGATPLSVNSFTGTAASFDSDHTTATTRGNVLDLQAAMTGASVASAGFGTNIKFDLETNTNNNYETAGRIGFAWNDPTNGSEYSDFIVTLTNNGSSGNTEYLKVSAGGGASSVRTDQWRVKSDSEGGAASLNLQIARQVVNTTSGTTQSTTLSIPSGAMLIGASFNVDTAITTSGGDNTWSAAFSGGSTTSLVPTSTSGTQNTKDDTLVVPEIASASTEVTLTAGNAETFTAGAVEIVVYYYDLTSIANA